MFCYRFIKYNAVGYQRLSKNINNNLYCFRQLFQRTFCMIPKAQSQTYVTIQIPKNTNKNKFTVLFQRLSSNQTKTVKNTKLRKTDILRLFSLAKPERWKLLGIIQIQIL